MTDYKSNNQKIAEWLGWKRELFTTPEEGEQLWISPTKTLGELPDFYGSEEANALVLEKMPEPTLWLESDKGAPRLWGCAADMTEEFGFGTVFNDDRKTAIAEAALLFIDMAQTQAGIEDGI